VIVDTTVQEKAIAFPTDARLMHRARERLLRLATKHGVTLRQSARVGKLALIKQQRYAHAKQFKRAKRSLKTLKTFLGRVIRDIARRIKGNEALEKLFAHPLMLARRVHAENKNLRPTKGAPAEADLRVSACMRRRLNASARARRTSLMSSASRSLWRQHSAIQKAGSASSRQGFARRAL
jgi:transposase, IS5 family